MTENAALVEGRAPTAAVPDLSIVIPVYERPMTLSGVLTALFDQVRSLAPELVCEIVVGDDGSAVDIEKLVTAAVDDPLLADVVWVRMESNLGRAGIRNAAAAAASGRRLLFMDCDSYPLPGLVSRHCRPGADTQRVLVGRRLELGWDAIAQLVSAGGTPAFEPFEEDFRFSYLGFEKYLPNLPQSPAPWLNGFTNNISVSRALFAGIDGFDEGMRKWGHEDIEIGFRLHKAGGTFEFDADACVVHLPHGRSPIDDEADSDTNLDFVKRKHPTYETELLGLETYTNIERKIGYFNSQLDSVRATSGRVGSHDILGELDWLTGERALWIGADLDVPTAPGVAIIEHGESRRSDAVQVLGFWTPFADDEFDVVVNVDLWRFYPISDLCLALEEGLRIAAKVVLVEGLPRSDHDDSWVMSSEYMHEALSTKGVVVSTVRSGRLQAITVARAPR